MQCIFALKKSYFNFSLKLFAEHLVSDNNVVEEQGVHHGDPATPGQRRHHRRNPRRHGPVRAGAKGSRSVSHLAQVSITPEC